jgi:hypothetical protein
MAFAQYPLRRSDACLHCHTQEELEAANDRFQTTPLEHLAPADLEHFVSDAGLTWGDDQDVRHFLPRIYELTAITHRPDLFPDEVVDVSSAFSFAPEQALEIVEHVKWRTWPEAEQAAVEAFLRQLWNAWISYFPPEVEYQHGSWSDESLLPNLVRLLDDQSRLLAAWELEGVAPARHLAWFILNAEYSNEYWRSADHARHREELQQWLFTLDRIGQLERAFFEAGGPAADDISRGAECLRAMTEHR